MCYKTKLLFVYLKWDEMEGKWQNLLEVKFTMLQTK